MNTSMINASLEKSPIIQWLDNRIERLLHQIKQREFWDVVASTASSPALVRAVMKEIYLEIVGYQPDVIEAAIAAIGQMPRSMEPRMVRAMLFHQTDEFDHGEMALRDYVGLGGDEASARASRMSPQSFAVAAVWWLIAHKRDPFAYLGALYLFEGLTPTVTGLVKGNLMEKGLPDRALEYIEFHSTEDVKHASLVRKMIDDCVERYPHAIDSIKYGYTCFEAVYPIPVWENAYRRATQKQAAVATN